MRRPAYRDVLPATSTLQEVASDFELTVSRGLLSAVVGLALMALPIAVQVIRIDPRHVTSYYQGVIKTFAGRRTQELYAAGKSKGFPPDIAKRAKRKLEYVDLATCLNDLKVPPGNRLHKLERDRKGQHAISINDQWRVCFRFVEGDAYDVEITDYH